MKLKENETRLFLLLDRAHTRLFKEANQRLKKAAGIGVSQASVLFLIGEETNRSLRQLAQGLGLGQPAITGLIKRMEAQELVTRHVDKKDARVFRVLLTEKGRKAKRVALIQLKEFNRLLSEQIPEKEIRIVQRFLARLANGYPFMDTNE